MRICKPNNGRHLRRAGLVLRGAPARSVLVFLAPVVLAACIAAAGCERPDSVDEEKSRELSADERYLVELYLKINDLEKNLQMNPEDSLKKWDELRASVDTARVNRALRSLEDDPERWVGIYGRINELDFQDH